MIVFVNAENRRLFEADLVQMCRQRKAVFVEGAGWKIPVIGDMEMDAYDREDTIYLLAKDRPDGQVLASVRLLATTRPHLMCDLFTAADRERVPRGPTVWEASRFCTAPDVRGPHRRHALLWEIICGVIETGLLYGIDEVIFAASRALLPLALRCGWEARTLGPLLRDDEGEVTAAAAAITTVGLREMRQRHGIPIPVTRFHSIAPPGLDPIQGPPCLTSGVLGPALCTVRGANYGVGIVPPLEISAMLEAACLHADESCAAVDGQRRSPLSLGQAAPVHQQIPSTGDPAHG